MVDADREDSGEDMADSQFHMALIGGDSDPRDMAGSCGLGLRHWGAALLTVALLGTVALLHPTMRVGQGVVAEHSHEPQHSLPFLGLTAHAVATAKPTGDVVTLPKTVAAECATVTDNCWVSRCCSDEGYKCFMKNKMWAGCKKECTPGVDPTDPADVQTDWTCYIVHKEGPAVAPPGAAPALPEPAPAPVPAGPPAAKGAAADGTYPKLFCMCIIRTGTYELGLVKKQYELRASIFGCEAWAVLSDVTAELSPGPPAVKTTELGDLSTGSGVRTHFANTDIFSRAFDLLKTKGEILQHDFVVKVDPDAVFVASRLKDRIRLVAPKPGAAFYFLNCKFQNKLWMFGAVEVLSQAALSAYYDGRDTQCKNTLDYYNMGEDTFLARCLDHLGIEAKPDFDLLSDGYCEEAPGTCTTGQVTYHPFKDPAAWEVCFHAAVR